jgi:adenylylsulfate reductase subunit B
MPSYVIMEKCDGCKGQDRTACMYICPNEAYNRDPQMCWE